MIVYEISITDYSISSNIIFDKEIVKGTLNELKEHFQPILEKGKRGNSDINTNPNTIVSFVFNLQKNFLITQAQSIYSKTVNLI